MRRVQRVHNSSPDFAGNDSTIQPGRERNVDGEGAGPCTDDSHVGHEPRVTEELVRCTTSSVSADRGGGDSGLEFVGGFVPIELLEETMDGVEGGEGSLEDMEFDNVRELWGYDLHPI
ncbi:unnamed protein product [Closterium sp. NIES-54]